MPLRRLPTGARPAPGARRARGRALAELNELAIRASTTRRAEEVTGLVRRVEMQPMTAPRPARYGLTLVPRLRRLTLVTRSRVHQNQTHLEVGDFG